MHYGNALDAWPGLLPEVQVAVAGHVLLRGMSSGAAGSQELAQLIKYHLRLYKETTFCQLRQSLQDSLEWREQFHALGCRGFSYQLDLTMKGYNSQQEWHCKLGSGANLRVALLAGENLFYPSRVKSYFRHALRSNKHHYYRRKMPAIAFCLGMKADRAWYVFVMQSDLASKGPSSVGEHFRGWRKILFANIVARAYGKADALYLCRAEDAVRACYPGTKEPGQVSERWTSIYDLTAEEWGMRLVKVREPVNVRIYGRLKPVLSEYFYKLPLIAERAADPAEQELQCIETH